MKDYCFRKIVTCLLRLLIFSLKYTKTFIFIYITLFSVATLVRHMGCVHAPPSYYVLAYITMYAHLFPSGATEESEKIMEGVAGYLYSTQSIFRTRFDFHVLDLRLISIEGSVPKI